MKMKNFLTEQERSRMDARVSQTEKLTGAQVVLAVVERSDSYSELPWKAFALGASIAGFKVCLLALLSPASFFVSTTLSAVIAVLAAGAAAALASVFIPAFARLFLDRRRAGIEVRQYAESLFFSRELFATRQRTGILLLISRFERMVMVLPDTGMKKRLSEDALQEIIAQMAGPLSANRIAEALEAGLLCLERLAGQSGQAPNDELPNTVVQEDGA